MIPRILKPLYLALGLVLAANSVEAARKPNVIFILADDLGYTDLGVYGTKFYETPNLDRLAASGARFTDGYTAHANCQPTRSALISGQYAPRTGIYTVGNINRFDWKSRPLRPVDNVTILPPEVKALPQTLKAAGYATGFFGKWHLGKKDGAAPSERGYDESIESNGKHYNFVTDPPVEVKKGEYLADFLTDKAVDFIERHQDKPFFLSLHHFGVHSPWQAKEEWIEKFKDKPGVGNHKNAVYAAMIASVDESVGRVYDTIKKLGLEEDTLIIFTSDNGGVGGYTREGIEHPDVTDNWPLKGGKGTYFEGGIRVPYLFSWKGKIAPNRVIHTPIHSVDLYPSVLEVTQTPKPENYILDGQSYVPELLDVETTDHSSKSALNSRDLFWHFPGYLGAANNTWRSTPVSIIRSGDWKLTQRLEDQSVILHNLKEDLSEQKDLSSEQPEKVKELLGRLHTWQKDIGAKFPTKNEPQKAAQRNKKRQA